MSNQKEKKAECANQAGLKYWKEYEKYLAQDDKKRAENFREHAISCWKYAARNGNADAMINLAIGDINNIAHALWLMAQVFSKGTNVTQENNLLEYTVKKPGFIANKIKVNHFLATLIHEDKKFFLWSPPSKAVAAQLKKNLGDVLWRAANTTKHEEIIEISFNALKHYNSDPRVSIWLFRLLSQKVKMGSSSKSECLGFLLEALDHFTKFISMPRDTFEKIESYGKAFFKEIDCLFGQLTINPYKKIEINWHDIRAVKKMTSSYHNLITNEQMLPSTPKTSPELLPLHRASFLGSLNKSPTEPKKIPQKPKKTPDIQKPDIPKKRTPGF